MPSLSRRRTRRLAAAATAVAASLGVATAATALPATGHVSRPTAPPRDHLSAVLSSSCLDAAVPLSVEEQRLRARLPDPMDPARPASKAFAQVLIDGGGFEDVGPGIVARLCRTQDQRQARRVAAREGTRLWRAAVARTRATKTAHGFLPHSDDRPLYWTRLQVTASLRHWRPTFDLSAGQREELIQTFEKASRGMTDVAFPSGSDTARVLVSGFDPYTLDGGDTGTATGTHGNNIRHGNPSGATALALDGTTRTRSDGRLEVVQAYVLPVNYTEFTLGWLEDTVGPWMRGGRRQLSASLTISQGSEGRFDLEVWNGRYRGTYPGNDASLPCPILDGTPQIAANNPGCNTVIPTRWGGPRAFERHNPPQWTMSSLPFTAMIAAATGTGLTPPPGATWSAGQGFPVVRNTTYTEFPSCASAERATRNAPPAGSIFPHQPGVPPTARSCAYQGGGGNYLSNESAYRNTLLRERLGRRIPAGHIHTPIMQHFAATNRFEASDASFDAWRRTIVAQTVELVHAAAR